MKKFFLLMFFCSVFFNCQTNTSQDKSVIKKDVVGTKKVLTLSLAKKMAQAIEKESLAKKEKVSISIYDAGGDLKYFQRMDHSSFGSVSLSQLKAKTSAIFPLSSKELSKKSAKGMSNPYAFISGISLLPGGVPIITKDQEHIGSIGVSGASSHNVDAAFAKLALDSIKDSL